MGEKALGVGGGGNWGMGACRRMRQAGHAHLRAQKRGPFSCLAGAGGGSGGRGGWAGTVATATRDKPSRGCGGEARSSASLAAEERFPSHC